MEKMGKESFGWRLRKYCSYLTARLLDWKFGPGASEQWLWNCTPFPFDLPRWSHIWQGLRLVDGSLSWARLNRQTDDDLRQAFKQDMKETT